MKTEELTEQAPEESHHFDAHEFDGLRALEQEAQSIFAKGDQFVRRNPWLCIALAAATGVSLACALRRK